MARYKDMFHELEFGAPIVDHEQITASGKLGDVLDRTALDDPDGDLIGFLAICDAVGAGDASNYFELTVHEATSKTDDQTLGAGEAIADEKDVLGYTKNGVRAVAANPDYDASQADVAQTELKNVQDGTWPKVYEAGKSYWFAYRGYEDFLQIFGAETGNADVTVTVVPAFSSKRTRNLVNPA